MAKTPGNVALATHRVYAGFHPLCSGNSAPGDKDEIMADYSLLPSPAFDAIPAAPAQPVCAADLPRAVVHAFHAAPVRPAGRASGAVAGHRADLLDRRLGHLQASGVLPLAAAAGFPGAAGGALFICLLRP